MSDDTKDLRAAFATLTIDVEVPPTLVDRGLRHGKRMRTRRRVVVATSVAASALAVAGVTALATGAGLPNGADFVSGGRDGIVRGEVVYRSITDPRFHVLADKNDEDVCFAVVYTDEPVKPNVWTCWSPPGSTTKNGFTTTILPGAVQSAPLSHGWSVSIDSATGDVPLMAYRPPRGGPTQYVPTVEIEMAPGHRFAFAAYKGSDELRGRFVPVRRASCGPDARTGYGEQSYPPGAFEPTAERALHALIGTTATAPGHSVPPTDGYRLSGERPDVLTFRHDGGAGKPAYEVDVFREGHEEYAAVLIVRCT